MGLIGSVRAVWVAMVSSGLSVHKARRHARSRLLAALLGLFVSLAAIGDSSSITVADGEVTITDTNPQTLNFPVSVTGDSTYDRYISFATADGTAAAGTDYTTSSGVFKLAAGANSGNIPVTVAGKSGSGTLPDKTFALNLDGAVGTAAAPAFSVNPAVSGTQGSASVVSLDINGDGKPDLVSNNSAFNVIAMLNTSAPGAATPTYAAPQQISTIDFGKFAVGDADNDGKPDLLVTDTSNSQLVLLRNTTATGSPTASFSAVAASLPIGTSSGATILAPLLTDMDNDGRPDAVMVNPNDQQVRVFRNTTSAGGAVSFGAAELYGISIVAPVLTAGDFNNDGKLDLAVGNGELLSTTAAQVLFNQGGATLLGAAQNISFGSGNHNADGIATGDFNHDGKLDLVLSDRGSDLPQVLLNTTAIGGNSFSFTAHSAGGPVMKSPDTLVVADYNGDGLPDLAVSDRDGPSNGNKGLIVFQNITAPGASSTRFVQLAGADLSFSFPGPLTLTDFNTDGKPDLAAVNSTSVGGPAVDVLANITLAPTATLAFSAVTDFFSTVRSRGTTAADFNRDGKPDLLTAGFGSSGVNLNTTAVGASTPSFAAPQTLGIPSYDSNSNTAADINGDGVADFIGANSLANQVAVQLNTTASGSGTISTGTAQSFAVGVTPRAPAAADLNGDGRPDLVVPNLSSNTVSVLLNATPPGDAASTTPSFTAQQTYATGTAPTKVALGDANGDGKPDLIVLNIGDHTVSVLLNAVPTGAATLNASSFSAQQAYAVGVDPRDVTTADVNGDGKPDLIVTNSNDGSVSVLLNALTPGDSTLNGNSFAAQQAFTANPGAFGVVAADLDGDGKPDLAVVNAANNGTFSILRNTTPTGSAALDANSFSAPFTVAMAGTGVFQSLAAADFNRDGKPDLAAAGANLEILSVVLNTQYAASLSSTSATGTIHYDLPVPITANPTALSFASRAVGETSATQFVTLTNSSGNQLALSIPTGAGDFAVDNTPADRCGTALNGGGASCRVYLRFTPSATGSRTATLSINSGAIDIALSGAGEARNPQLSFVPDAGGSASVPFGNQPVNMQSTPQSVEIRNSGNVPLNLSTTAGGNDPTTFTLDPSRTCGATLAVNASCTYAWRFTPTAVRVFTAATTINASDTGGSNAAAPPLTADLLGAGIGAIASLAPASLDFGNIPVGNSSTNQLFTLENTGDATLTITSILSDSSEFEILGNGCGAPMSLGGTCSFFVRFVPNATGARSGTVSVISNGGNPTSDLSGTGTATDATIVDPPPVTDAEPNQSYTSASITITGINVPTAISVTDGEYSINGGAFTAVAGTVQPDDAVRIRRNASPDFATQVSATLTVGSVSVSYHVTTRSAGTQADAFSFTPANDVSRNTVIVSNGISVSGIEIAVPIGIVGGEYSVNGGAYTSAAGTVNDGDSVTVRVTSSASFATAVTATLTVGQGGDAQSADFVVTTLDAITAPNPFGFGSRSDVALNSEQTSNDVSIDGINTDAPVSVTGGEYSIDGGAFTSADGTIAPGGQVRVRVTASSQFSTGATVTLNVGGVEGSFVVTTLAADTTPDAFGFGSIDDIPLNSVQTSNEVTITGLNTDAPISVSGGEYSIDGGSWTSAASTIAADASVRVRVTAAGTFSTPATATLDIGGVTADFTVTTLAAVTDPNAFSFGSVSDVPLNSVQTSAAVAITGINTGSPVSIVGGEYSIDDGPFTAVDGLINPDQTVAVRTTASGDFSTAVSVTLTVGSVTGTYTVTTLAEDTTPDGFSFNGVTGVNPSTEQTSDPVTITGINSAAAVTVTGGSYSIDGGPFTSAPGTITSGQQLRARTNASPGFDTTVQATVSVGGVSAQFNVTTRVPVRMPDAFSFTPQTDVALDSDIDSNPVAISGIEVAVPISIVGGQYSINGGAFTAVTGTILAGQSVVVRVHSDTALASTTTATLTVGDGGDAVAADFSVTTLTADTDPDAFSFTPVTGAEPNSLQASHAVTISGVNTAVSISVVGGAYSIDGGAFTVAAGTVNAGQLVRVQLTASGSFSSAAQATLTVGGVSADFTVTTRDANTTPVLFSFTPVTDAALDALVTSDAITVTGIEAPTAISVSGDTDAAFCIDGNPCTAMIGATVSAGQSVRLQVRSSPDFGTTTTATVDIGGVTADFDVTTLAEDTSPDPFSFTAVTGADPSTLQISDAITVAGINSPASVSVTGGRYSIDGGAFTASVGTVNAGSSVRVENTASPDFATTTTTTLDIAGVAADFDVTTRSADTQADAFSFTPANDVSRNTVIVSNGISVSGIEIAVPIGIVGGEYSVNGGAYTSAAGTVNDGDSVTVRVTSSESFAAAVTATLTVGQGGEARSADFVVTTLDAITAPNPFGFGSRSDVALNSEQTSNDVSIDGINTDA
ncbi:choice-of-anchor D domain-containing protein, partial [Sinimarinibacterium sp. CAU 1509]|uniref:FG-GAP-like repeat-containing protein n=1 Tax=Sinimarinibacterium sp. CAU 1509 TaxID=2562283 RepID=UPI0010AC56F5